RPARSASRPSPPARWSTPGRTCRRTPSSTWPWSAPLFVLEQLVFGCVAQGEPARLDDVLADADSPPDGVRVAPLDDDADASGRLRTGVDDAHFIIIQVHFCQAGVHRQEGLLQGP